MITTTPPSPYIYFILCVFTGVGDSNGNFSFNTQQSREGGSCLTPKMAISEIMTLTLLTDYTQEKLNFVMLIVLLNNCMNILYLYLS